MAETPQEYTQRILDILQGADPIKTQAATPKKIERLLAGASAAKLRKRPAPGKWSVAEIIAHLADDEIVTAWRFRQILGAPGSPIQAFDQNAWAASMRYDKRDARKSLAQFRAVREINLALLKSLSRAQWKQFGIHAERGEESVEKLARLLAGHDINHLRQIERILLPDQPKNRR